MRKWLVEGAIVLVIAGLGFLLYENRSTLSTAAAQPAAAVPALPRIAGLPLAQADQHTRTIGDDPKMTPKQKFAAFWKSYLDNRKDRESAKYYIDTIRGLGLVSKMDPVEAGRAKALLLAELRDNGLAPDVRGRLVAALADLGPDPDVVQAIKDAMNSGVPELAHEATINYIRLDQPDMQQVLQNAKATGLITGTELAKGLQFAIPLGNGQAQIGTLNAIRASGASPDDLALIASMTVAPLVQHGHIAPEAVPAAQQFIADNLPSFPADSPDYSSTTGLIYARSLYAVAQASSPQNPAAAAASALLAPGSDPRNAVALLISSHGPDVAQALVADGNAAQVMTAIQNYQAANVQQPYIQKVTDQSLQVLSSARR